MTTTEPFLPHPDENPGQHEVPQIAAADPGSGAPEPAPGFGVTGEEPDRTDTEDRPDVDASGVDTPFRTPSPPEG